jgi:hypothetical protein
MEQRNPWLTKFFNVTAGLEKAIIAVAAAFQVWVGSFPTDDGWSEADKALIIALIGVVQIIYATNTEPVPAPPVAEPGDDELPLP